METLHEALILCLDRRQICSSNSQKPSGGHRTTRNSKDHLKPENIVRTKTVAILFKYLFSYFFISLVFYSMHSICLIKSKTFQELVSIKNLKARDVQGSLLTASLVMSLPVFNSLTLSSTANNATVDLLPA